MARVRLTDIRPENDRRRLGTVEGLRGHEDVVRGVCRRYKEFSLSPTILFPVVNVGLNAYMYRVVGTCRPLVGKGS